MTFDPASLFSLTEAGAWYDPSDLATLWQDTAATAPLTAEGQPLARIDDKSGNGHHLTQATAARMPTYQLDAGGKPFLQFDGIDDFVSTSLTLALPFDRISAVRQVGWTVGRRLFHHGSASFLNQRVTSPQLNINDGITDVVKNGGLAVGANGVVTERHVANASQLAINNHAYVSGDAGGSAPAGAFAVGGTSTGTSPSNMCLYGLLIRAGSLSDEEIGGLRGWMAEKAGVSFASRRQSRHSYWV